jgi:phosphoglycerate dehydrogenase-like enzyme
MLKGIFLLSDSYFEKIYPPYIRAQLAQHVHFIDSKHHDTSILNNLHLLQDVQVIFSGWGVPRIDDHFLQAAPKLQAVFHGAGSIRGFVTDDFWARNILVTSAYGANAIPVAQFTLSQIIFSLKKGWSFMQLMKSGQLSNIENAKANFIVPGLNKSVVGLISLGMIGRTVCQLLQSFDLKVIAYDPYVTPETADELKVELCSLEEVMQQSDVVSVHTPLLPQTKGLITGEHFAQMKPHATFINTSRGGIVREQEMIDVLHNRPDLYAVLDVTDPEPPIAGSPLYELPNVILTPHIAGALSIDEIARLGEFMVAELERYVAGQPLSYAISREQMERLA